MKKKKVQHLVKKFSSEYGKLKIGDLPKDLKPDDYIVAYDEEGEDCMITHYLIYRDELETDVEFEERTRFNIKQQEFLKNNRYGWYLELKKEFENEK